MSHHCYGCVVCLMHVSCVCVLVESNQRVDVVVLRSQLLSNKALANMQLKNYRSCIKDCDLVRGDSG